MVKKGDFRAKGVFGSGDPLPPVDASLTDIDSQIYGSLAKADELSGERLKRINIFDILPDAAQPRRALPSMIRRMWDGQAHSIPQLIHTWQQAIIKERGKRPFDLITYLHNAEPADKHSAPEHSENPTDAAPGLLEAALLPVLDLAISIRRDGLTNPITVVRDGDQYKLETGERRWLAYHILMYTCNGTDGLPDETAQWERIPAREVDDFDVWRQATENNVRADLNAIGKARQYAVLMMNLNIDSARFKAFSNFKSERDFYAQALECTTPYGKGELMLNAMGVSSRSALSRYKSFLELPDEIWQGADDLNIAEETLYKLAQIARKSPQKAIDNFEQIVLGQNNSTQKTPPAAEDRQAPGTKRYFADLAKTLKETGPGKRQQNAAAISYLQEVRRWLDEEENRISRFQD